MPEGKRGLVCSLVCVNARSKLLCGAAAEAGSAGIKAEGRAATIDRA